MIAQKIPGLGQERTSVNSTLCTLPTTVDTWHLTRELMGDQTRPVTDDRWQSNWKIETNWQTEDSNQPHAHYTGQPVRAETDNK